MATTNRERVGQALELLKAGIQPYLARELKAHLGPDWQNRALENFTSNKPASHDALADVHVLLQIMWHNWNLVFSKTLGHAERSLVSELREIRNGWAHQQQFSTDDAYRALDSTHRLLTAISAPQADEVDTQRQELLRTRFEQEMRNKRKRTVFTLNGQPLEGLPAWRQVVTPHPDVASGRYQQAEFAADLDAVYRNKASVTSEYRDPNAFYQRTYLTEGLTQLLKTTLQRVSGQGGAPVVELQTNFGGGKTHSMLALYHLFSGAEANDLLGISGLLTELKLDKIPYATPVVLVGTSMSPVNPMRYDDGVTTNTLWGELAYQLGGGEGYAMLAEADQHGVSPGSDALYKLFQQFGPAVILIDEWVAYIRLTYGKDYSLPGGTFDSNITFAQSLTEAVKQAPGNILIASLPQSRQEAGGEGGREALERLEKTVGRLESAWRPASTEEGFEIVRRRLFQPLSEANQYSARDAVVDAFSKLYREQNSEFPSGTGEAEYTRRMKVAYPIHPELFDRLYEDWSSLEKFQRTRGVLQLMATVIQALWERDDQSLLIMPATIPLDQGSVQSELMKYLPDNWLPIIETDVDGHNSLSLKLDRENRNLGRYSACRRVARAIFIGSAPTFRGSNPGLEERNIRLASIQPGETVPAFGDALRRLTQQANHLYVDRQRYWFSTQPSVTRLAQDRANQLGKPDELWKVWAELQQRLKSQASQRGELAGVHSAPTNSGEVVDEATMRLVILGPEYPHSRREENSPARQQAEEILTMRGNTPRLHRNMLVFLAPDKKQLAALTEGIQEHLAWKSIHEEREELNLDAFQRKQAKTKTEDSHRTVDSRIKESYIWLLVPEQPNPALNELEWEESRLTIQDGLADQVSRKLLQDELLIPQYSAIRLEMEMTKFNLWLGQNHVPLKKLWEYFSHYPYMPRLKNQAVLLKAIQDGVAQLTWRDYFAYAGRWDEAEQRYMGLVAGQQGTISLDGLLVKADVVQHQLAEEERKRKEQEAKINPPITPPPVQPDIGTGDDGDTSPPPIVPPPPPPVVQKQATRFYGSVTLDSLRASRDFAQIMEAVIQHLTSQPKANVTLTLDIQAELPSGASDQLVRTVTENAHTLKFDSFGFEE